LPLPDGTDADEREFVRVSRSRTTVARLVDSRCAARIARRLEDAPIETSNDLMLDRLIGELDLNTYWLRDPLFVQGSETGVFPSSLGVPWRESSRWGKLRASAAKLSRRWRTRSMRTANRIRERLGPSD
jgi:hypothetical protein